MDKSMKVCRVYSYSPVQFPHKDIKVFNELKKYAFYIRIPHSIYIYDETYELYKNNIYGLYDMLKDGNCEKYETIDDHNDDYELFYYDDNASHDGEDILDDYGIHMSDGIVNEYTFLEWCDKM
jgi:hypothetical protein